MATFTTQQLVGDAVLAIQQWIDASGGGRHLARSKDGTYHHAYLRRTGQGDFQLRVASFTLDPDGTFTVDNDSKVTTYGSSVANPVYAIDIDENGSSTERVVVLESDESSSKIRFHHNTVSGPSATYTTGDDFNHSIVHPQWIVSRQGFQIIGRVGGSGTMHAIYTSRQGTTGTDQIIFHRTLSTTGGTWSSAAAIDNSDANTAQDGGYKDLAACADPSGNLHVVWSRRDSDSGQTTRLRYSTWTGASWSSQVNVFSPGQASGEQNHMAIWFADICADLAGDLHVVLFTGTASAAQVGLRYIEYTSSTWQSSEEVHNFLPTSAFKFQYRPAIGADKNGEPYVFWSGSGFGAQQNSVNPLYATRATGSWEFQKITDEGPNWGIAAVAHDVFRDAPSTSLMATVPMIGTMTGKPALNDVFLVLTDDFEAGLEPKATVTVTASATGDGENTNKYVSASVSVAASTFPNPEPLASVSLTAAAVASVTFTPTATATTTPSATAAAELLSGGAATVSVTPSVTASQLGEIQVSASVSLAASVEADNFRRASVSVTPSVTAVSGGDFAKAASVSVTASVATSHQGTEGCTTEYVPDPSIPTNTESLTFVEWSGPWPADSTFRSVVLRRPNLGDRRAIDLGDEHGKTRAGGSITYTGPHRYRLTLPWTGLTRKQAIEIEDFLSVTAGKKVRWRDHNSHTWEGHITNYPTEHPTQGREQASWTAVFEGSLVT